MRLGDVGNRQVFLLGAGMSETPGAVHCSYILTFDNSHYWIYLF